MSELSEFIISKYPPCSEWPEGRIDEWANWARSMGYYCECRKDGTITAIAIARPTNGIPVDHYEHEEEGDTIYVDLVICSHPLAFRALIRAMFGRFGWGRDSIAFKRFFKRQSDKHYKYNYKKFITKVLQNG